MLLTTIFYHVDNFCKNLEEFLKEKSIGKEKGAAGRKRNMTTSEVLTIMVHFHHSQIRTFKDYYKIMIQGHLRTAFSKVVSYNRFVELMKEMVSVLYMFTLYCCSGTVTGISFIDSMPLAVCHNLRISSHKVFKGIAERGKSSTGWFYGFKLHIIVNEYGEIISFTVTPGNTDDRNQRVIESLTKELWGKLFGDRGYLSKALMEWLQSKGIQLFTRLKKNMKNVLMTLEDKILLSKRGMIESINYKLQSTCHVKHTRHRSVMNFFGNIFGGIAAYHFLDRKPTIVKYPKMPLIA